MEKLNWSRVLFFSLLVAIGLGLGLFVNSLNRRGDETYLLIVLVFVVIAIPLFLGLGYAMVKNTRQTGTRHLADSITLIQAGQADRVIAQANGLRRAGDRSPENAIVLAAAYAFQGRGSTAETFAQEAVDLLEQAGRFEKSDSSSRWLCDLAQIGLYNARITHGRFVEAGETLSSYATQVVDAVFMKALAAWAFFLDARDERTRSELAGLPPTGRLKRHVSGKYFVVLAHMRHQLAGEDAPDPASFESELAGWEAESQRNAHNPYGPRLREILTAIRSPENPAHPPAGDRGL